tara:strand:+ start:6040 stop:6750 length:711 start_codon:yes stop_codon:yes gene_type:complete
MMGFWDESNAVRNGFLLGPLGAVFSNQHAQQAPPEEVPVGMRAQEHLDNKIKENTQNKMAYEQLCKEREQSHATEVPPDHKREYPDVYVNGKEVDMVTVTVDPTTNQHWIRDDSHAWRHAAHHNKGAIKDHAGVMRAIRAVDTHGVAPSTTSQAEVASMIRGVPKWTKRCVADSTRGYRTGDYTYGGIIDDGDLPTISKMLYEGRVPNTPDYIVEQDVWAERNRRNRVFDCDGWCR